MAHESNRYCCCNCRWKDTPLDIAMARRVLRDMQNASGDEIRDELDIYIRFARDAYVVMLEKVRPSSDYIIDGTMELDEKIQEIMRIIQLI